MYRSNDPSIKLIDETGASYGIPNIQGKPRVSSVPYYYEVAAGNLAGHTAWTQFGFNGDVGTTEEDIWTVGGNYTWPATAQQMEIVSSSIEDDPDKGAGVPGTGIHSITIYYLDDAHAQKSETLALNGTGVATTTATDLYRIQTIHAASVGTGGVAAGTINIRNLADTPVYAQISPGYNHSRQVFYAVPVGLILHMTSVTFSVHSATKGVRFTLRTTYDEKAGVVRDFFLPQVEVAMSNGAFQRELELPLTFPATTRFKVSGVADLAGAVCSVAMRGWTETA